MSCEEIQSRIHDDVSGRLGEEEAASVEDHVARCPGCRRFRALLERLRGVDLPRGPVPDPADPTSFLTSRPWATRARRSTLLAAALVLAAVGVLALRSDSRPWEPLPFPEFQLTMPRYPQQFPENNWVESSEEARLLASFTGRPLLEGVVNPACSRCQRVEKELDSPQAHDGLGEFVGHRQTLAAVPPEWVASALPPTAEIRRHLPAIRVGDSNGTSRPVTDVNSWTEVRDQLTRWRRQSPSSRCLDRPHFEKVVGHLDAVPRLLAAHDYGKALNTLREVEALEQEFDTAFVELARDLENRLRHLLDDEISSLEALARKGETERLQARDLAARLHACLGDVPEQARLARLLE